MNAVMHIAGIQNAVKISITTMDGVPIRHTIYFQVKPVPYGNFIPGRFYIDPYDVISDIREK